MEEKLCIKGVGCYSKFSVLVGAVLSSGLVGAAVNQFESETIDESKSISAYEVFLNDYEKFYHEGEEVFIEGEISKHPIYQQVGKIDGLTIRFEQQMPSSLIGENLTLKCKKDLGSFVCSEFYKDGKVISLNNESQSNLVSILESWDNFRANESLFQKGRNIISGKQF